MTSALIADTAAAAAAAALTGTKFLYSVKEKRKESELLPPPSFKSGVPSGARERETRAASSSPFAQ